MGWPDLHWKHGKRSHKAYSRYWKHGRSPVAAIPRKPALQNKRTRLGRRVPDLYAEFPHIKLRARVTMIMAEGVSEREAIQIAMLEVGWKPGTSAEIDRVRMVLRRMSGRRTDIRSTGFADRITEEHIIGDLHFTGDHHVGSYHSRRRVAGDPLSADCARCCHRGAVGNAGPPADQFRSPTGCEASGQDAGDNR